MKKCDVKRVVDENIEAMKTMLGLDRWDIDLEYKQRLKKKRNGQCTTDFAWINAALITLVPGKLDDKEDVLSVLQHELVHCITSSHNLCMTATAELVSKKEYQALLVLHYRAVEEVTEWICRILDSMKALPREHCTMCKKESTPDKGLIPFTFCWPCFERCFPKISKDMKEDLEETTTKNILDVVKDTPQSKIKTPAEALANRDNKH